MAMRASATGNTACFVAGITCVIIGSFGLEKVRDVLNRTLDSNPENFQDGITLDALGQLTRSENVALQRSAAQMLMDRAMHDENLQDIVTSCQNTTDKLVRLKACTTLGLLSKNDENRPKILLCGGLEALAGCLIDTESDLTLKRVTIIGVFDLIYNSDENKDSLIQLGILPALLTILDTSKSKDLLYWALVLVHQLALKSDIRPVIIDHDGLRLLVKTTKASQGHNHMQKLCLHSLVLLCSTGSKSVSTEALRTAVQEGILSPAAVCLKADDQELVYWALGLIHELAVKDVAKSEIQKYPGILKIFYSVLVNNEPNVQIFVLRTLGFLAIKDDIFKEKILKSQIPEHLLLNLSSSIADAVYWAVVLIHDLAMCGEAAATRLLSLDGLIPALVTVVKKNTDKHGDTSASLLIAETFGFLCVSESNHLRLVDAGVLVAIGAFTKSTESDLLFWAAALLLNFTVASDGVKERILANGGLDMLIELVTTSTKEQVPFMAAKTLVMLGIDAPHVNTRVARSVLNYLMRAVMTIPLSAPVNRYDELGLLGVFARGDAHKLTITNKSGLIECLATMVWNIASANPIVARKKNNPMYVHGVSALKCLVVLSSHEKCQRDLLHRGAVSAMAALVVSLNKDEASAERSREKSSRTKLSSKLCLAGDMVFDSVVDGPSADALNRRYKTRVGQFSMAGEDDLLESRSGERIVSLFNGSSASWMGSNTPLGSAQSLVGSSVSTPIEHSEKERGADGGVNSFGICKGATSANIALADLKLQAIIALANCSIVCRQSYEARRLYAHSGALHALWSAALWNPSPSIDFYIECTLITLARARKPNHTTHKNSNTNTSSSTNVVTSTNSNIANSRGNTKKASSSTTTVSRTRLPSTPILSSAGAGRDMDVDARANLSVGARFSSQPILNQQDTYERNTSTSTSTSTSKPISASALTQRKVNASTVPLSQEVKPICSENRQNVAETARNGYDQNSNVVPSIGSKPDMERHVQQTRSVEQSRLSNNTNNPPMPEKLNNDTGADAGVCDPMEVLIKSEDVDASRPRPSTLSDSKKDPDLNKEPDSDISLGVHAHGANQSNRAIKNIPKISTGNGCTADVVGTEKASPQFKQPQQSDAKESAGAIKGEGRKKLSTWVEFNEADKTDHMFLSADHLQIRNDNWTFESIRATVYIAGGNVTDTTTIDVNYTEDLSTTNWYGNRISSTGKWGFEVLLKTSGILQIGWAAGICTFEADKGIGVGDNAFSYAYDGSRCRAWHGGTLDQQHQHEFYGAEWKEGDVVSVLMDIVAATISYSLNGKDLGVAFVDVDTTQRWYPAISLATGQQCLANFGASPFMYDLPAGYNPLSTRKCPVPEMPLSRANQHLQQLRETQKKKIPTHPLFYFEATVSSDRPSPMAVGLHASDGYTYLMKFLSSGQLMFVKQSYVMQGAHQQIIRSHIFPDVAYAACKYTPDMAIGCGISMDQRTVFFTLDGVFVGSPFPPVKDLATISFPYVSGERLTVNFGQRDFSFLPANRTSIRQRMASVLSDQSLIYITSIFVEDESEPELSKRFVNLGQPKLSSK
eukprot:CFRG7830T1